MWYPISQLFKLLIYKVLQNFHHPSSLRDFEGAIVRVCKDHLSSCVGREFTWFTVLIVLRWIVRHYCCISHAIITLLLFVTSFSAFSQDIIIGYHTFLLDITYSHYCAFWIASHFAELLTISQHWSIQWIKFILVLSILKQSQEFHWLDFHVLHLSFFLFVVTVNLTTELGEGVL